MSKFTAAVALYFGLGILAGCGGGAAASPPDGPTPVTSTGTRDPQPKDIRTGAGDSLSAESFEKQHVQDIAELLQSRVAGLRVIRLSNGDISLRIRGGDMSLHQESDGTTTAESSGEPLLVINGMPVSEGQLSNTLRGLDPHEIDNIQVLKDVSSTSSYGMRGAHGVILITLKRD
jgi:TonB-dependent SusC/RagA subfamily outer membrane receptor